MKQSNPLENQLRSWKPRAPSARLKARIFGRAAAPAWDPQNFLGSKWAWLAPVMGCFLVLSVLTSNHSPRWDYSADAKKADWFSLAASNQSFAAYIMSDFHSEQNSPESVQWTNLSDRTSPTRSFLLEKTNRLIW